MMKVGFIGVGNMGEAILGAAIKQEFVKEQEIFAFARSKNSALKDKFGINVCDNEHEVAKNADLLIIAIKPAGFEELLKAIKDDTKDGAIILSVASGISINFMSERLNKNVKIVRSMPNVAAAISQSVTAICFGENFTHEDRKIVMKFIESFGSAHEIEEKLFAAFVAIAGSLPAYVFVFIEALADGAVLEGMPRLKAYEIASRAVASSANLISQTGKHPAQLKDAVCSPMGTTIEAIAALEKNGFRNAVIEAVKACSKKAKS
ncbi:pyrroline-5-carboxylate reductase [Campylobacter sp. RM12916]|nr:pyrroline-5-carboxylate reductase [Campylobacter sp. RM12916]